MDISIENRFDRLNLEKSDWNRLAMGNGVSTVFQTYEWNRCWWEVFGKDHDLFVITARAGGELAGLAPLMIVKEKGLWGVRRVLQFIGTGHSDYCDFLARGGAPEIVAGMMEALFQSQARWDQIRLVEIPDRSESGAAVVEAFRSHGSGVLGDRVSVCPALVIKNNAAFASRVAGKKSLRRRHGHFKRRSRYEVLHLFDPGEIEKYLDRFFSQHVARWDGSNTPSLFIGADNRLFYQKLTRVLGPNRWLIFTVVKSEGEPIAFHFGFECNNILTWYKPAFDPLYSKYSPGQVLLKELLDYAITTGKDELDFTVGNEPFKKRFSNFVRQNRSFSVCRRPIDFKLERAHEWLKRIGSFARGRIKSMQAGRGAT